MNSVSARGQMIEALGLPHRQFVSSGRAMPNYSKALRLGYKQYVDTVSGDFVIRLLITIGV